MRHIIVTLPGGAKHHAIFLDLADMALVLAQFDVCYSLAADDPPELVPTCTPSHIAPILMPEELADSMQGVVEPKEPREVAVVTGGLAIICQPFEESHRVVRPGSAPGSAT
jgi:hypothetical protein